MGKWKLISRNGRIDLLVLSDYIILIILPLLPFVFLVSLLLVFVLGIYFWIYLFAAMLLVVVVIWREERRIKKIRW